MSLSGILFLAAAISRPNADETEEPMPSIELLEYIADMPEITPGEFMDPMDLTNVDKDPQPINTKQIPAKNEPLYEPNR